MRLWVRLKFGQTVGQVELWSDMPPRIRLSVRLTFGETLGQVDSWSDFRSGWPLVRCTPWQRHLVAKCDTTLGQVDLWSDVPPGRDILWLIMILL